MSKWKMPKGIEMTELRDFVDEKRGEYDEMSERWQEGDNGGAVGEWLDQLESICDDYDNIVEEFDGIPRDALG